MIAGRVSLAAPALVDYHRQADPKRLTGGAHSSDLIGDLSV